MALFGEKVIKFTIHFEETNQTDAEQPPLNAGNLPDESNDYHRLYGTHGKLVNIIAKELKLVGYVVLYAVIWALFVALVYYSVRLWKHRARAREHPVVNYTIEPVASVEQCDLIRAKDEKKTKIEFISAPIATSFSGTRFMPQNEPKDSKITDNSTLLSTSLAPQ